MFPLVNAHELSPPSNALQDSCSILSLPLSLAWISEHKWTIHDSACRQAVLIFPILYSGSSGKQLLFFPIALWFTINHVFCHNRCSRSLNMYAYHAIWEHKPVNLAHTGKKCYLLVQSNLSRKVGEQILLWISNTSIINIRSNWIAHNLLFRPTGKLDRRPHTSTLLCLLYCQHPEPYNLSIYYWDHYNLSDWTSL